MNKDKFKNIIIVLLLIIIILLVIVIGFSYVNLADTKVDSSDDKTNNEEVIDDKLSKDEVLTEDEALNIVKDVMPKAFEYFYVIMPYCGERDVNDYISINESIRAEASKNFKTLDELNKYLATFLSNDLIEKYSKEKAYIESAYTEENGKLYCLNTNKDCGKSYNAELTTYSIQDILDNKITFSGKIAYNSCDVEAEYLNVFVSIEKDSNDNWIVSEYREV